jgi:hypothetical protein
MLAGRRAHRASRVGTRPPCPRARRTRALSRGHALPQLLADTSAADPRQPTRRRRSRSGRSPPARCAQRQLRLQPVLAAAAASDELLPRRPERVVDDRAEPKGALGFDDEPAAPADDRRDVVRRCHEGGALRRYLLRARAEARPALPAQATSPVARAAPDPRAARPCACGWLADVHGLISSVRPFRRRLPPRASRALLSA